MHSLPGGKPRVLCEIALSTEGPCQAPRKLRKRERKKNKINKSSERVSDHCAHVLCNLFHFSLLAFSLAYSGLLKQLEVYICNFWNRFVHHRQCNQPQKNPFFLVVLTSRLLNQILSFSSLNS